MSSVLSANEKRSIALKGKYFPHKVGKYSPSSRVFCGGCGKLLVIRGKRKYEQRSFYCQKCTPTVFKKKQRPYNFKGGFQKLLCGQCGKSLVRSYNQAHEYKNHFCNQKCAGIWKSENLVGSLIYNWKGGYKPYYGLNWKTQRFKCRIRDKNTCQICHKTTKQLGKNMGVDHRIPSEAFLGDFMKANDLINLWCLCPSCHTQKTNWQVKYGKLNPAQWEPLIKQWYPS